jgi:hypothetical protein
MILDRDIHSRLCGLTFVFLGILCGASHSGVASVYANGGVRGKEISVCFVGDALASRPSRVQQIQQYVQNYRYAANIVFNFIGSCPPAIVGSDGNDFYDGDIRIVIPNTSVDATVPVPGKGCPATGSNSGWGSWSNFPNDLIPNRSCLYNMKLGDDPWAGTPYLNHTLHEFGHALGLAHEHERSDVDRSICAAERALLPISVSAPGFGGPISSGLLTPYDRDSVMHYQFLSCGIDGNYGYSGLSILDQLGVHILYPEDQQVAEFVGTTVIRTTDLLSLESAWEFRGANINIRDLEGRITTGSTVANGFVWQLNSRTVSTTSELSDRINTAGTYTLKLNYDDFMERSYSYTGLVRVLRPQDYINLIAAPIAAQLPLL